jgi:hypothetical protein
MLDQSGFARLRARFESALEAYQMTTGVTLAEHPLALQIQSCRSRESIATLLKSETRAFTDLRGSDRIMRSIESITSILSTLSETAILGEAIDLVRENA